MQFLKRQTYFRGKWEGIMNNLQNYCYDQNFHIDPNDQRIIGRPVFGRPGFGRPFYGVPFASGLLGGLLGGALVGGADYGYS
jgi:hypothetical protein